MKDPLTLAAVAGAQGDLLKKIGPVKALLALVVVVFFAGVGAMATIGEFASHEARLQGMESWQEFHVDSVTGPRLRQLNAMEIEQEQLLLRLGRIEVLVSCMYYEIKTCPDPAPSPPPGADG